MHTLGIDPGTKKMGWVLVKRRGWKVHSKGHSSIGFIQNLLFFDKEVSITDVVIEGVVRYKVSNSTDLIATAIMIGRVMQICSQCGIIPGMITRPEVIEKFTGRRPCRGHKVDKSGMQMYVQQFLGLDKPVRPQHANDALAAVLALRHPKFNVKNTRPRRAQKASRRRKS